MKICLELNMDRPNSDGNIFSESAIDAVANAAINVPVFLGGDFKPFGIITDARKTDKGIELEARLDENMPETEFFEKGHVVYWVSYSYKNMDFEQINDVLVIKSAELASVTLEPGRKLPPESRIYTIN
jgi:hypothetical protein